jgi:hypothetical protein
MNSILGEENIQIKAYLARLQQEHQQILKQHLINQEQVFSKVLAEKDAYIRSLETEVTHMRSKLNY